MEDNTSNRLQHWKNRWNENDIGWHNPQVHRHLQKHSSLLFKEYETKKFFIPLCGKTLDMKWLSDKGHTVAGLDGVRKCLEDFCSEQGFGWTEEDVPSMGPGCQMLKVKGRPLNLYRGDIFLFKSAVEGQFDCVWDRGCLGSLDREDVTAYVALIKDLLKPCGKMLVEVFEFDVGTFDDVPKHPPPFAVFKDEMKSLFEQDFTLEVVDRDKRQIRGKDVKQVFYLAVKK